MCSGFLFAERVAIFCGNKLVDTHALCERNEELLNAKEGGVHRYPYSSLS
jgi:hypothetical protein